MADALDPLKPKSSSDYTEVGLLYRATPIAEAFNGRIPLFKELHDVTIEFGVETATLALARILQDSRTNGAFSRAINEVDATTLKANREAARNFEVTVVASNLYQSGRRWGDHTETWSKWARSLGFTTETIETSPRNSVISNAREISQFLRFNPHPKRILVTYGQGATEFRQLLRAHSPDPEGVVGWINICGAFGGATSSSWLLKGRFRRWITELYMRAQGRNPLTLQETSIELGSARQAIRFVPGFFTANIVGLPLMPDIQAGGYRMYNEISKITPNDGAVGFLESIAPGGATVGIRGMSHKAEDEKLEAHFKRALEVALQVLMVQTVNENERANDLSI